MGRKLLRRGFWGILLPPLPLSFFSSLSSSTFLWIPLSQCSPVFPVLPLSFFLWVEMSRQQHLAFQTFAPRDVIEWSQNSNLASNCVELITHTLTRLGGGTSTETTNKHSFQCVRNYPWLGFNKYPRGPFICHSISTGGVRMVWTTSVQYFNENVLFLKIAWV